MKVAIDTGSLSSGHAVRGVGFYTRHLTEALEKAAKGRGGIKLECFDFALNKDRLPEFDVVHYPYFDLFFHTLPMKKSNKTVVTVHDVIPLLYPEHYPPGLRGKARFFLQRKSLLEVDKIITDTETSKKDIVRLLGIDRDRIEPIHLAQAKHFRKISDKKILDQVRKKYGLPRRFVLYVGDVNYNKNIKTMVVACAKLGIDLVIVGKQAAELGRGSDLKDIKGPRDWMRFLFGKDHPEEVHYKDLYAVFEKENVRRLGFVPDTDLVAIYNLAWIYCQPSFYEGFGLPVLEAMICGCPVVCSKTQALVEVTNGFALYFNPHNTNELVKKISMIINESETRRSVIEKGYIIASRFSWEKTALLTLQVYDEIV